MDKGKFIKLLDDEPLIDQEVSDESQDQKEIERDEPLILEVMSVAEASKRVNQLSRFLGKVRARKRVYESMLSQEYSVSDNVQDLVYKALEKLEANKQNEAINHE
ncbi:hypothetical protein DID80_04670 [Candidatus Marinamargulisbacteria bacterium SCGC AAA071-K20]|nr:hypothetical protein DID80_04670 [Candidatus Marinamargulisbacteria bacterium SCGC AAA071-K20]